MTELNWKNFGKLAYETHINLLYEIANGKGPRFPAWHELSPRIQQTWIKTAEAVIDTYSRAILA